MKNVLLLLSILFFCTITLLAQNPIPNPSFENWNGNIPNGWSAPANIPQAGIEPIMKSPEAYADNWAVRGIVLDAFGNPYPPVLYAGTITDPFFPVSANHDLFSCWFKFFSVGGDRLFIEVVLTNNNTGGLGEGHAFVIVNNTQIFEKLEIPIEYDPDNPPNFHANVASITVTIAPQPGQTPHVGTWFLLDLMTFDNLPSSVEEINNQVPNNFELAQNYPNPFNPKTNINFSLPEASFVNLKVYNIQGEEVATLVNQELSAGTYKTNWNALEMPSGVYVYVLKAKDFVQSRKMLLMK